MVKRWEEYHKARKRNWLQATNVRSISEFTDEECIELAEANATCYHPREDHGWNTRIWLEEIRCVLNHGCCTGCGAKLLCRRLSSPNPLK